MKTKKNDKITKKVMYNFKTLIIIALLAFSTTTFAQYKFKNESLDLRPQLQTMGLPVRDFSPVGTRGTTCTFFAFTFLVEYYSSKKYNLTNLDLSEEYLVHATNRANKYYKDKGNLPEALLGYNDYGIVTEQDLPYAVTYDSTYLQGNDSQTLTLLKNGKNSQYSFLGGDYTVWPSNSSNLYPGFSNTQFDKLKSLLDEGNPIGISFIGNETAGNFTAANIGNGRNAFDEIVPNAVGQYLHAVALVGYKVDKKINGGGYVIFRNCGGESWGDHGYGYMTFNFLGKFVYDFIYLSPQFKPVNNDKPGLPNRVDERYQYIKDYFIGASKQLRKINIPYLTSQSMKKNGINMKQKMTK